MPIRRSQTLIFTNARESGQGTCWKMYRGRRPHRGAGSLCDRPHLLRVLLTSHPSWRIFPLARQQARFYCLYCSLHLIYRTMAYHGSLVVVDVVGPVFFRTSMLPPSIATMLARRDM
ncbi:hypothetical protein EJ05DRAFT_177799 [Pseudovirgaria hyperparasitica]|uniref:Uncharacterized protein n=1 Tax=Pseudovirgaria hyperparasitica TaxID=470096 RepID=A0A6A6WH85_9PEZI|nr:uncharacterized protein EJ05DRAFT_177799 [Pseudovirgaria hyperparasitica]KAF2761579.1 hypothetical protein EJ05DRAFT_177799 [Pseudovirgaria hyperparasitica]